MEKITIGVLTVSDRCSKNEAIDESGQCLMNMLRLGAIKNGVVTKTALVPDCEEDIQKVLIDWCNRGTNLILTTGGTGISSTDVTPEATAKVLEKQVPGISSLLFKRSSEVTPLAALTRGIAGVRGRTLIINLPGSKKASRECLEAVACVIPHAIDLIIDNKKKIEQVHSALATKKSLVVPDNPAARGRKSSYPCISVSEAQNIITGRLFLLRKEKIVSYDEALGFVLAQDVAAQDNLPPYDASLKDGYAVLSSDQTFERTLIGISTAGNFPLDTKVTHGCCVRISTGAAVPPDADAVVQVEDTEIAIASDDQKEEESVALKKLPFKGQDIRPLGSDFKVGERLLKSGTYLDAAAIGLLAAAGVTSVRVFKKPLLGILSTGDEIVSPDQKLSPGKVRDSNRITLISLLSEENFKAVDLGIASDEPEALRGSLERGFRTTDVVVTTGSMSMGERDYLKEVLVADFNAEICFGRVLMKPGKPTSFAIVMFEGQMKLWFGLPGNPASALVTSQLFLLPALRKISGHAKIFPISVTAKVDSPIPAEDRPHYVRGILTYNEAQNSWYASVKGNQSSSRIGSCVNANCLLEIPAEPENALKHGKVESKKGTSSFSSILPTSTTSEFSSMGAFQSQKVNNAFNGTAFERDQCAKPSTVKAFLIGKSYFRA